MPKKKQTEILPERLDIRGKEGLKAMLEKIGEHYGISGYGTIITFLATKEAKRLKLT